MADRWVYVQYHRARKQVKELSEALERYGGHLAQCASLVAGSSRCGCTCGFRDLVEKYCRPDLEMSLEKPVRRRGGVGRG